MQRFAGSSGAFQRLVHGLASAGLCSSSAGSSAGAPASWAAWGRRSFSSDAGSDASTSAEAAAPEAAGSSGGAGEAGDAAAGGGSDAADVRSHSAALSAAAGGAATPTADDRDARMERLMRVLLQPISRSRHWVSAAPSLFCAPPTHTHALCILACVAAVLRRAMRVPRSGMRATGTCCPAPHHTSHPPERPGWTRSLTAAPVKASGARARTRT